MSNTDYLNDFPDIPVITFLDKKHPETGEILCVTRSLCKKEEMVRERADTLKREVIKLFEVPVPLDTIEKVETALKELTERVIALQARVA